MRIEYHVTGEDVVAQDLLRIGERTIDARPAFAVVAEEMRADIGDRFDSQGRGSWPALKPATVARKAAAGLDPRILHATNRLRDSFTDSGSPDAFELMLPDMLVLGSDVPYGIIHDKGAPKANIPQRKVISFAQTEQRKYAKTIQRWAIEGIAVPV